MNISWYTDSNPEQEQGDILSIQMLNLIPPSFPVLDILHK